MVSFQKLSLALVAIAALAAFALLVLRIRENAGGLRGQVLERDKFLETQIKSDFRRDGKIDFIDFTFFSTFYKEQT